MITENLRRCRYDGEEAVLMSREGRNAIGTMGFVSQCVCTYCKVSVWAWSRKSKEDAEEQAVSYWNRGIYDGK